MNRPGAHRGRCPPLAPLAATSIQSSGTPPIRIAEASNAEQKSANAAGKHPDYHAVLDQVVYSVAELHSPITAPDSTENVPWHLREAWEKNVDCPELVNWDGSWLPPPIDWHVREQFTKHRDHVRDWIDSSFPELADYLQPMPLVVKVQRRGSLRVATYSEHIEKGDNLNGILDVVSMGEIAPRYWIPEYLEENLNANTYWELFKMSKPYSICNEDQADLEQGIRRPWWQSYPSHDSFFLLQLQPSPHEKISVDPSEESQRLTKLRVADKGSAQAARSFLERQRIIALRRSKKAAADRGVNWPSVNDLPMTTKQSIAGAIDQARVNITASRNDVLVRGAKTYDIDEIAEIYNYYCTYSCVVLNKQSTRVGTNLTRLSASQGNRIPFLVAVDKNTNLVLGFAYCAPISGTRVGSPGVSLQLYTLPNRERQGAGSALMDRVLSILDSGYAPRGAEDIRNEGIPEQHCHGRFRSIVIRLPHFRDDKPKWLFAWLRRLGWVEVQFGREIRRVEGRAMDISVLQRMLPPCA